VDRLLRAERIQQRRPDTQAENLNVHFAPESKHSS
jgi:hypothetical protein